MPVTITIRDVPEVVRDALQARATRLGVSLEDYLRAELEHLASKPSAEELMDEVRSRKAADPAYISAETILRYKDAEVGPGARDTARRLTLA